MKSSSVSEETKDMKKIICWFKGHKRGETTRIIIGKLWGSTRSLWQIRCERCGYFVEYGSPYARLVGKEIELGFDGE